MNDQEWFEQHNAYLKTPEWAFKRGQVLQRDGYRCQARLKGCNGEAVQVHHLTYKHWRSEPLFDLTSVCVQCHESITAMDRGDSPSEVITRNTAASTLGRIEELLGTSAPSTVTEIAGFLRRPVAQVRFTLARHPDLFCVTDRSKRQPTWGLVHRPSCADADSLLADIRT